MNTAICEKTSVPTSLEHRLRPHLAALARFRSTKELRSSELYRELSPEIDRLLNTVDQEEFAPVISMSSRGSVRATAWNIERGTRFDGLVKVLREHASIGKSDVLLLTELDYGMARSGNRYVAREMAAALEMNYVFAPCYVNLAKGSGLDREAEGTIDY